MTLLRKSVILISAALLLSVSYSFSLSASQRLPLSPLLHTRFLKIAAIKAYPLSTPYSYSLSAKLDSRDENEHTASTNIPSLGAAVSSLWTKIKVMLVSALFVATVSLSPAASFAAKRGGKTSGSNSQVVVSTKKASSTSRKNSNSKSQTVKPSSSKKPVVEVIIRDEPKLSQESLTKIGLGLSAVVVVLALVAPIEGSKPKSNAPKRKISAPPKAIPPSSLKPKLASRLPIDSEDDDDFGLSSRFGERSLSDINPTSGGFSKKFQSVADKFSKLPSKEEFFGEESVADMISTNQVKDEKVKKELSSVSKRFGQLRNLESADLADNKNIAPILDSSKIATDEDAGDDLFDGVVTPPPPPTPVASEPVSQPEKKGLLSKIFGRRDAGRPTNLIEAIKSPNDPTHGYRSTIASALSLFVPEVFDEDIDPYPIDDQSATATADAIVEELSQAVAAMKDSAGLNNQDSANVFAEVTNAMLVSLVDNAATKVDKKANDDDVLVALDSIATFIRGAGAVFAKAIPQDQVTIEPVFYSGKTKKGKLEDLFYRYYKSSMSLDSIMAMTGLTAGTDDSSGNAISGDASGSSESPEEAQARADKEAKAALITTRMDSLGLMQQVLTVKESKRSGIEQKVMREMLMSAASGEGGMGDLGGMLEALTGGKGAGGMGGMADLLNGKFPGNELDPNFAKELENMDPKELAEMSKGALDAVKASLDEGSITRKDVEELEKIMGMDMKQMVKMFDSGQVDKSKLRELGGDVGGMIDLFRKLAEIK